MENVDELPSPSFPTAPSAATFFSTVSVMFRFSSDTAIKPIACPRKPGPTQKYLPIGACAADRLFCVVAPLVAFGFHSTGCGVRTDHP
jgi:hypothetical protein